jgi:hypothetical protein
VIVDGYRRWNEDASGDWNKVKKEKKKHNILIYRER